MAFPRQLRPALFYYRTSCTYRYDYLSLTDSQANRLKTEASILF